MQVQIPIIILRVYNKINAARPPAKAPEIDIDNITSLEILILLRPHTYIHVAERINTEGLSQILHY